MTRRSKLGWIFFAALYSSPALAASADLAQQLFGQGVEAARQDRWNDARLAFERAYELSGKPVVLINLAGAQAKTGFLKEAATNYRGILADSSAEMGRFRKAAADVLPSLEARIPKIRVHAAGLRDTDRVEIDGEKVPTAHLDEPHLVDPGPHTIVVKRSGIERARVAFSLAEGESHDVSLPAPVDPPPLPPPPILPAPNPALAVAGSEATTPPPPPHRSWLKSPWLWTTVAVVAAATAASIVLVQNREQPFSGNVPPGLVNVQ